jgi:hypothetical protein
LVTSDHSNNKEMLVPDGISLYDFLSRELLGSTLAITSPSKNEILIESEPIVRIHVKSDDHSKTVRFDIYSPRWSRQITVQQLDGFEFMESQAEELLEKENADAAAEDSLLALDMIRLWAAKNKYESTEVEPEDSHVENADARASPVKTKRNKGK